MGMSEVAPRKWFLFSSSSGQTLAAVWKQLDSHERAACQGIFMDRPCGAVDLAQSLPGAPRVQLFERPNFESQVLQEAQQVSSPSVLVLLCGFFGILTESFLKSFPGVIVNTHPSLLPSFPGMDKKVHRMAAKSVAISGFTVHLVSEELDGGTVLFQHPVWVNVDVEGQEANQEFDEAKKLREDVRVAEQAFLPQVWKMILQSDLNQDDLNLNSFQLRKRLGLNQAFFTNIPGVKRS